MNEQGKKLDSDKPRFSLIPSGVLPKVINVLEFGAKKYAPENWRKVPDANTRYFDAAHRHLDAWWNGQQVDSETNESHLAHAICCLMFLLALERSKTLKICDHNWQEVTASGDQRRTFICSHCSRQKELSFLASSDVPKPKCNCAHWKDSSFFHGETHLCADCGGEVMI